MNPKYLLKDELQCELSVLGSSSDRDVGMLRKLFRSIVAERVPVDLRNLSTHSVEELYECVVNKTLQLQYLITQQKSDLALLTPRTQTSGLRGRLQHLREFDPTASDITTSKYQEVHDRLHNIESNLAKMDVADGRGHEKEGEDDKRYTMQKEASV